MEEVVSVILESRSLDSAPAECPSCGGRLRKTGEAAVGECVSCDRRIPLEVLIA